MLGVISLALAGCASTSSSTQTVALADHDDRPVTIPAGYARVPLQHVGNLLYIRGAYKGKPVLLIVDTGASSTTFDRNAVTRLGIPTQATGMRSIGIGAHSIETRQLPVIQLDYPGISISCAPTQLDLTTLVQSKLARGMEAPGGLLGLDVMKSYDAIIDLREPAIYFRDPTKK
ncbi:MAG TPA: aspartyl protease family protein [Tepidisphaeraceae bacterium]|nr:aspartyl protease family protein [Tepidisphaeraceae bacterium]